MTPMFSPYVVVPDPPPEPATMVATPSASSARPVRSFRAGSVICATPRMCPTFSATSTSTTGMNAGSTVQAPRSGPCSVGSPTQAASSTAVRSKSPNAPATTYPSTTARKIDSRDSKPRKTTVARMTADSVSRASQGDCWKLPQAAGARLNPISATIVPDTTGGSSASTQPVPVFTTMRPISASSRPTAMIPNWAAPIDSVAIAAVIGAMNANEEPR